MNNKRLVQIIKDPGKASEKEIKEINALSKDYSYASFLKILQARLDNQHGHKNKSKSITRAAIYAADRIVLKNFISNDDQLVSNTEDIPKKLKEKAGDQVDVSTENIPSEVKDKTDARIEQTIDEVVESEEKVLEKQAEEVSDKVEDVRELKEEEKAEEERAQEEKAEEIISDVKEDKEIVVEETFEKISSEDEETTDLQEKQAADAASDYAEDIQEKSLEEKAEALNKEEIEKDDTIVDDTVEEEVHEVEELKPEKAPEPDVAHEEIKHETTIQPKSKEDSSEKAPDVSDSTDKSSLSSEIMKNISELRKHKASLFNLLESEEKTKHKSEKKNKPEKSSEKREGKAKVDKKAIKDKGKSEEKIKDKAAKLVESPEKKDTSQDYPNYEKEDPKVIKEFLEDLEKSNPPPNKKLKKEEQKELIEKFIQTDPQMQNVRSSEELPEKKDLSLPSVKFRDDIISENLACIMVKQGKHEKAIDIYKKLIWKFPQKKTYFATQIEELKKKSGK